MSRRGVVFLSRVVSVVETGRELVVGEEREGLDVECERWFSHIICSVEYDFLSLSIFRASLLSFFLSMYFSLSVSVSRPSPPGPAHMTLVLCHSSGLSSASSWELTFVCPSLSSPSSSLSSRSARAMAWSIRLLLLLFSPADAAEVERDLELEDLDLPTEGEDCECGDCDCFERILGTFEGSRFSLLQLE